MKIFYRPTTTPTLTKLSRLLLVALCLVIAHSQTALAQTLFDLNEVEISHYTTDQGSEEDDCKADTKSDDTDIDRFLKALAMQESGGNINAVSTTGAKGKYQYIDSTWVSSAARYYPPASEYATALMPPADSREAIQDAVAFFEYTQKFKDLDGDLFKLAVSHFYPAALTDESKMDVRPPGNVITPREYGEAFVAKVESNAGADIELHYKEAPDFDKIVESSGAAGGATASTTPATGCPNTGASHGKIVDKALEFAWPNRDHGPAGSEMRPAYAKAKAELNPAPQPSDCGAFVATVMRASGADPNYPPVGTAVQLAYVTSSDKYEIIKGPTSTSQMQPGDIMITSLNNGTTGHTYIYIGDPIQAYPDNGEEVLDDTIPPAYEGVTYNALDASLGDRVPGGQNAHFVYAPNGGDFTLARLK